MSAYQSIYTGTQIDNLLDAVNTAVTADGIVNINGLNTILGNYLTSTDAANTYLTISDAENTYETKLTAGTTGQFYRGDKSWSNTISGNILNITANSNTVSIGSQNESYCHFINSADIPFYFNKSIQVNGSINIYGTNYTINTNGQFTGNAATATALGSSTYGSTRLTWVQTSGSWDGNSGWCHYLINNHGEGASYFHYTLGFPFWGPMIYRRQTGSTSSVTSWYTVYSTENSSSSRWIKENIEPISIYEAKKILNLNIVKFDYKKDWCGGQKNQIGLIAEDTEPIIPSAVHINQNLDKEGQQIDTKEHPALKSILWDKLVPYCIKMIQIQQKEIDELHMQLKSLEKSNI